jgi:hypothetical protein
MATRIPSHGPASTGVFEAMDYLEGEGNQTIVSETSQTLRVPIMMEIHCLFSVKERDA